ncbi:MAG: 2-dehydropantoate 2-reductase, partial [Thermoplasmata archaeon]
WSKAIINSCINPITAVFDIKNGEIIKHPILYSIAETICRESTKVAVARGIEIGEEDTLKKLRQVIENTSDTSENYSSMVQSLRKRKPTEIDSINGIIVKEGKKKGIDTSINELFLKMVKMRERAEVKG